MMKFFKNVFKSEVPDNEHGEVPYFAFPKEDYKVYWETMVTKNDVANYTAEVRLIGYRDFNIRVNKSFSGTSEYDVKRQANVYIREVLPSYKRVA